MKSHDAIYRLVLLIVAVGLFTTALEARYLHRDIVGEDWIGYLPTVVSIVGGMAAALALCPWRAGLNAAMAVLALCALIGCYGVIRHSEGDLASFTPLFTAEIVAQANGADEQQSEARGSEGSSENSPPVLAPLGITGLSAIGLILAFGRRDALSKHLSEG